MRIGFDAKRLFNNNTGLGNYSRTLVDNISKFHPEHDITLFSPNAHKSLWKDKYSNFQLIDPHPKSSSWWRSVGIYKAINDQKIDIYHGLSNEIPFTCSKINAKIVVTIHDLFYEKYPQDFSFINRKIYKQKTEFACKNADHIIAISEATKSYILKYIDVDESKISVVYQSCNSIFQDKSLSKMMQIFDAESREIPSDFILFVGTLNYRKNILGLLNALSNLEKSKRLPLVIVGQGSYRFMKKMQELIVDKKLENEVFLCGHMKNNNLKYLYEKARFTCLPSFYEGFGIPIIESLFSNTPVFTSNNSALVEATGPCGALIDPNSSEEMSAVLLSLFQDDFSINTYKSMISNHISQFNFKNTAKSLEEIYTLVKLI